MKNKTLRIIATIEARLASTRLPGKVLFPLAGKTTIERIVERLRRSEYIDEVVVATTVTKEDKAIEKICQLSEIQCYCGSVDNIVERLLGATEGFDIIVQATGDNPFIDSSLVDHAINLLISENADFVCNNMIDTFPRGLEVKVFKRSALESIKKSTSDPIDLVHGSYYFYRHPEKYNIRSWNAENHHAYPSLRLTVDEPEDYILAKNIYDKLYAVKANFNLTDILNYINNDTELLKINSMIRQRQPIEG